ncbi:MAG: phosphotransferase [bacterium]
MDPNDSEKSGSPGESLLQTESFGEVLSLLRKSMPPGTSIETVTPLEGDASDRRYFRIRYRVDPSARAAAAILMRLANPWAPEERRPDLPFVNVARHLSEKGLPVPRILVDAAREGFVLLEDAGDATLQQALRACAATERRARYREAVDLLVRMQREASKPSGSPCYALQFAFDGETFFRELCFFADHAIEGLWKKKMRAPDRVEMEALFHDLCRKVADLPRVFTHRDYHSRNLMVRPGGLLMLDFQDARLGPYTYDLASLLLDSYVALEPQEQEDLLLYYCEGSSRGGADFGRRARIREELARTGLQRNLKAIGTFAYQAVVRKNERYLPYVPGTVCSVRRTLERYEDLTPLRKLLEKYVEGLS